MVLRPAGGRGLMIPLAYGSPSPLQIAILLIVPTRNCLSDVILEPGAAQLVRPIIILTAQVLGNGVHLFRGVAFF